MKAKTFFKFLVLFLALGLSSCGGDNKKGETAPGGGGVTLLQNNGAPNGSAANAVDWGTFTNQVANNQFGGASSEGIVVNWRRYTGVSDLLNFSGGGFDFNFCWNDCFDQWNSNYGARRIGPNAQGLPVYRSSTFAFDAELGSNLQQLLSNLVSRMRSATNVKKCINGYCAAENDFTVGGMPSQKWYFEYGNRAYIIDSRLPLAANPVAILKKDTNEGFAIQ